MRGKKAENEKPDALNVDDVRYLVPIVDAGIRQLGLAVFEGDRGVRLHHVLQKLQAIVDQGSGQ